MGEALGPSPGRQPPAELVAGRDGQVRKTIGPIAAFKTALVVDRLSKTRSGKILRGTMRKIADGEAYQTPATIEDPEVLSEIEAALAGLALLS